MPTETAQTKILLITRNLPPLLGGMERMMQQLAIGINQYAELTVIGPRGCKNFLPGEIDVHETSTNLGPFLLFSSWLALRACKKTRFDVIIGGSGLIGPLLCVLSRLFSGRTLVYLHGLDLVVNSAFYQMLFVPCLRHIGKVAVNSGNTRELAVAKGLDERRIVIVYPGTNLPEPVDSASRLNFRQRYGIPFERYLVFTGRMTKRKGLAGFLQHALPIILENQPAVGLVVVGEDPRDSLNRLDDQVEIQRQIIARNLQENVVFLGKLTDRDLEICFAEAALQIFPLVQVPGDVEGFGMVAIEAAACGTPTVAFELGGVADAIAAGNGYLVPPGEYNSFAETVVNTLRNNEPSAEQCMAHAKQFTWKIYNEKMRALIDAPLSN